MTTIKPPGTESSIIFNLDNSSYYLQIAQGNTDNTAKIQYHDKKTGSNDEVRLDDFTSVSSKSDLFVKLHGVLMVLAWLGTANLGIFPARYCRNIFQVLENKMQQVAMR